MNIPTDQLPGTSHMGSTGEKYKALLQSYIHKAIWFRKTLGCKGFYYTLQMVITYTIIGSCGTRWL